MKHSQRFALNEWLSEYPRDLSYNEVIKLLREEDELVAVWSWLAQIPTHELIENIDNTFMHFAAVVEDMHKGLGILDEEKPGYDHTWWMDKSKLIYVDPNDVTGAQNELKDIADAIPQTILHSRVDDETDITVNDVIASIFDFLESLERQWL